MNIDMAQ